ncbi:MAG: hypothetical protein R3B06_32815 [Kofleriaceae bacterium]
MHAVATAVGALALRSLALTVAAAVAAIVAARWLRRPRAGGPSPTAPPPPASRPTAPTPPPPAARPAIPVVRARRPAATSAGLAVATSGMVCPTCRTEYTGMQFCQRDARRLVAAEDMLEGRAPGAMCPRCGRAFDPGLRRCPDDQAELVPVATYRATRRADPAPTGVLAKTCPVCRNRFDLSSRFCGRDGHELVVVN